MRLLNGRIATLHVDSMLRLLSIMRVGAFSGKVQFAWVLVSRLEFFGLRMSGIFAGKSGFGNIFWVHVGGEFCWSIFA